MLNCHVVSSWEQTNFMLTLDRSFCVFMCLTATVFSSCLDGKGDVGVAISNYITRCHWAFNWTHMYCSCFYYSSLCINEIIYLENCSLGLLYFSIMKAAGKVLYYSSGQHGKCHFTLHHLPAAQKQNNECTHLIKATAVALRSVPSLWQCVSLKLETNTCQRRLKERRLSHRTDKLQQPGSTCSFSHPLIWSWLSHDCRVCLASRLWSLVAPTKETLSSAQKGIKRFPSTVW